jgi:hypothetical protein
LLDYLAAQFMEDGWSMKKLIRRIMLSKTYCQSSNLADCPTGTADARTNPQLADPDNTLLWRMNRRRLDFEALRDSLLAVSGQLDTTLGGRATSLATPTCKRRTIYGFIDRQNLPGMYRTFDFASPDTHSPQRYTTTVPQQALFLMNSPFLAEQSRRVMSRPEVAGGATEQRLRSLYRLLYHRPPSEQELSLGVRFVQEAGGAKGADGLTPWEQYAQVLLLANEFAFVD